MKTALSLTVLLLVIAGARVVNGATVPAGITDTLVANGLTNQPRWLSRLMVASLFASRGALP